MHIMHSSWLKNSETKRAIKKELAKVTDAHKILISDLKVLFTRDLNRLKTEIELYRDEDAMWSVQESISNSGGNLCLHLIGNLKTYIGMVLGNINYERDRIHEFEGKDVPRDLLYREIDETIKAVIQGLDQVTDERLTEDFPILIWDKPTGMVYTLIHLHGHLNYHLGQINYHRRLLDQLEV